MSWSLTARWVLPVSGPPLPGGVVTIDGERIAAVEPAGARAADVDLGNVAVLPGLVNAHTHLDLSGMRGLAPPSPDFTGWLRQVIAHRRARTSDQVQQDIRAGLAECVRSGTTLIGDISGDGGSWDVLADAPIRAVVFRELLGLPRERAEAAWQAFARWYFSRPDRPACRAGVSPHAPYSVRLSLFRAAAHPGLPLATHLAESAAELDLLARRDGPFVTFLQQLGVWAPDGLAASAAEVVRACAAASPLLLVHGNFLADDVPVPAGATVVYCPRTHAAFGHPPHPVGRLLARGVRVALGTDGLACNPDLDLLAEARFLHRQGAGPPATVLRLATLAGAEALGWADETGSLAPGKSADLAVVALPDRDEADPHRLVLDGDGRVVRVLGRGRWLFP